jgi:hypothetical protein
MGGAECVGISGGGRPARRAEARCIQDGVIDVDKSVPDSIFDRREI